MKLPLHFNDPGLEGNNGFQLVEETIAYGNAAPWGSRFYLQEDGMTAATPVATDPSIVGATENSTNRSDYILELITLNCPRCGHQMDSSAYAGLKGNCTENGGVSPCTDVTAVIQTISNIALTYTPAFVEYFSSDATYSSAYSIFSNVTTPVGGTLRP